MGKAGRAFTFAVGKEIYKVKEIQAHANVKIERQKIPSVDDVEEIRLNSYLDKIKEQVEKGGLDHYTNLIERLIGEDYTSMDIAAALLKLSMGESAGSSSGGQSMDFDDTYDSPAVKDEMSRLFISIGRNQRIDVKDVLGAIAGETGIPGKRIGKIEVFDKYTFVEVPKKFADDVIRIMNNNQIKGIKIGMEWAAKK